VGGLSEGYRVMEVKRRKRKKKPRWNLEAVMTAREKTTHALLFHNTATFLKTRNKRRLAKLRGGEGGIEDGRYR